MPDSPHRDFLTWPLAAAAIVCFFSGITVLEATTGEPADVAAAVLISIGTMMAGAWIFALGTGGHKGGGPRNDKGLPPPKE